MCNLWVKHCFLCTSFVAQNVLVFFFSLDSLTVVVFFSMPIYFYFTFNTNQTEEKEKKNLWKKAEWYWSNRMCCLILLKSFDVAFLIYFYVAIVFYLIDFHQPYTFERVFFCFYRVFNFVLPTSYIFFIFNLLLFVNLIPLWFCFWLVVWPAVVMLYDSIQIQCNSSTIKRVLLVFNWFFFRFCLNFLDKKFKPNKKENGK